jgi:hypothetical protein
MERVEKQAEAGMDSTFDVEVEEMENSDADVIYILSFFNLNSAVIECAFATILEPGKPVCL